MLTVDGTGRRDDGLAWVVAPGVLFALVLLVAACGQPVEPVEPDVPVLPAGIPVAVGVEWPAVEKVTVTVGGHVVAEVEARGAHDGPRVRAMLPAQPSGAVDVVFSGKSAHTERLRLFAFPDRRSLVVCDVDHTIYDGSWFTALRDGAFNRDRVIPGSPAALQAVAQSYGIVYLSARDERLRERTNSFLEGAAFPAGPLLLWSLEREPVSRAGVKSGKLRRLRDVWPWLAWGIGDRDSDLRAYRSVGMRTILITPGASEKIEKVASDAWHVREWAAVPAVIRLANGL